MTPSELFVEGVNLMISGMGFVLVFLFILILVISGISNLINRFFPEPVVTLKRQTNSTALYQSSAQSTNDFERLRPVIIAAIAHHRRSQGLN